MATLDKARAAARRARGQAERTVELGRARMDVMRARRQRSKLLQQLGEACYAEHSGEGTHEAVVRRLAALDAHAPSETRAPGRPETARHARDIMHPGAECIGEDDSIATAAQRMRDLGVSSLPICGADDRLHGIITDRDIAVKCIAEGRDPAQVRAGDLAQRTLFWVDASADIGEVLKQMGDHQVKRLPVIENHRMVGIISEADLARDLDERQLAEFVEKIHATS
jgi:CBS domain-containing protein